MEIFRKHREKLSRNRSEGGQSRDSDDEQTESVVSSAFPADAFQKRASEPTVSYYASSLSPEPYNTHGQLRRNTSSAGSELPGLSLQIDRSSSASTSSVGNPLGLTLVHAYPNPICDLVFVHGLGGTSRGTWSWNRDPENFWPPWLGDDSDLSRTRIFTFGYNAAFAGSYTSLSILDFAKDLLFRMKTYTGENEQDNAQFGEHPIIFVAHSMGGLVVKKAYIIGKSDPQYTDLVARISSIVFLATPHKGSAYAQTLNSILKVSPINSAKAYVAELEKNSSSLQDINEQFRHICAELELVSFYETLKTSIGAGIKRMIVEKDAALLEYPGETSSSLIADHHGMAKFKNHTDTNYANVRNVLKWLAKKTVRKDAGELLSPFRDATIRVGKTNPEPPQSTPSDVPVKKRLMDILGISDSVEDDLEFLLDRTMEGSCHWLLQRQAFQDWVAESPNTTGLLWLTGNPGSGKSIIASFVVALLKKRAFAGRCHYHFFLQGHQSKRTLSYLLRSIAFQAALSQDNFCLRLLDLHENTGMLFGQQKATVIWEKIFEGVLFRLPSQDPFFWVFDGLDEAESPTELIKLLSKVRSATRINIFLVSRATKDLLKDMNSYLPTTVHEVISADDVIDDIRGYVRTSIQKILPSDHAQEAVIQDILAKASGSFLWVKLALDRIRDNWYTQDDIRAALTEIPEGMEPLYERMIDVIASQPPKPRAMATRILTWVACSFRPLEIAELKVALEPEFKDFVNLGHTAEEICGQFVIIKKSTVTLIHQTASQFLLRKTSSLPITITESEGHKHIATACIDYLSDNTKWRRIFSTVQAYQQIKSSSVFGDYPFLTYALSFWAYHVSLASVDSDEFLSNVLGFLEENCLLWINGVALFQSLRILTQAAQHLKTYVKRRAHANAKRPPTSFTLARDGELRQWANDLIRLVGRFGNNIAESPSSIHKHVVPFCPKDSIISSSFGYGGRSTFSVTGMSSNNWDDCLARLNMGEGQAASKVFCKDTFFITLIGVTGTLIVWHAETCEEIRRFTHEEYVSYVTSSKTSNFVATAGFKTTRVWDITTGEEVYRLPKERHHHTRAVAFGPNDEELLVAYDDCIVQCFDLATAKEKWQFLAKEPGSQDFNCARYMSFSPDLTQIAVVFRGRPVVVWNIHQEPSTYVAPKRCVLTEDSMRSVASGDAWNCPEVALWQPGTDHLVIFYEDTKIVEWNIVDDEQTQYSHTNARGMTLSPDGSLLLTSDVNGTLSIWMVPEYRLTYQLRYEELVTDLAFSPDGTRFYDIRGTFCNVWETDALIRPNDLDQEDISSAYETLTSEPIIANDDNTRVTITALASDSSNRFFCCGKEDGTVTIYSIPDGQKVRKLTSHSSSVSIIRLAWSASEKYLASSDDSGRIITKRLELPTPGKEKWAVFPVFDIRVEEAVEQFLYSTKEEYLLVAGQTSTCVMSMKSKKELCLIRHALQKEGVWINHPTDLTVVIRIDSGQEHHYYWKTLEVKSDFLSSSIGAVTLTDNSHDSVQRTVIARSQWLILEILTMGHIRGGSQNRHIELLDLHKLPQQTGSTAGTPKRQRVDELGRHVRRLIGSFQDRVVFMDHHFWLCTWEIEPTYSKHKRHFFLPKDWLSPSALALIVLNNAGTLLCPRNGEVAIVRSGLKN
ncbi:MAG: hypothetical protein MMC33_003719 [Icmadophila ericetorum]|nr:hypothetical protein [Icmadophila ericetorum]